MASNNCPENLRSPHEDALSAECGAEELEALESDVKQMAQKILEYRETLPDRLKSTLASILAAQRPLVPVVPDPGSSQTTNPGAFPGLLFRLFVLGGFLGFWVFLNLNICIPLQKFLGQ